MAHVKLTTTQAKKLKRLLDMWYRPSELAEEMDMHVNTVYRLMERGCPHRRQGHHFLVRGTVFRDWVIENRDRPRTPLAEDEALCMRCRGPRKFVAVKVHRTSRKREQVEGRCAVCNGTVFRFRAARRRTPNPDQSVSEQAGREDARST